MAVETIGFDALKAVMRGPRTVVRTPAAEKLRLRAIALAQEEGLGLSSYAYRIVDVDRENDGYLDIGDEQLFAPWLVPESGELTGLGVGISTLGPALERRVTALFGERQAALALALDQLGAELLFATSARLEVRLRGDARRAGLSVSGELRPGDPGLALEAQRTVMKLMAPIDVGVQLHNGAMLNPIKSTSVIYGVGRNLPAVQWSRCDLCPSRDKCSRVEKEAVHA